mmetsp:Transcript_15870/g.32195  ORF Transcript_15870/g.32195 Transcript_15870/m.32195 type:complete len:213 (+) Transcript_15870:500-1138(+)
MEAVLARSEALHLILDGDSLRVGLREGHHTRHAGGGLRAVAGLARLAHLADGLDRERHAGGIDLDVGARVGRVARHGRGGASRRLGGGRGGAAQGALRRAAVAEADGAACLGAPRGAAACLHGHDARGLGRPARPRAAVEAAQGRGGAERGGGEDADPRRRGSAGRLPLLLAGGRQRGRLRRSARSASRAAEPCQGAACGQRQRRSHQNGRN